MTPRVRRVTWQSFRVPMRHPFGAAHGTLTQREGLIVRLETDDGGEGIGEASPLPFYAGGSLEGAARALELLARAAHGRTLDECWESGVVVAGLDPASIAAARSGFETAVADATARGEGLPLWSWLARRPASVVTIPVNAVIDASEAPEAARQALTLAQRGFSTFKVKAGTSRSADIARVAAVRDAIDPDATIRVDANGAWDDATARAILAELAPFEVGLCEQPVPAGAGALEALARLRADSPVPIAADESCRSLADLHAILRVGAADAIVVKPMVTGLREAMAMLDAARVAGLPAIVTTTFDSGVGVALAAHLAALLPEPRPACGLATLDHLESHIVVAPPEIHDGRLRLPSRPGLGVTLDEQALRRYAGDLCGEVRA